MKTRARIHFVVVLVSLFVMPLVLMKEARADSSQIPSDARVYNGHWYYLYPNGTAHDYNEAVEFCKSLGGHMVTVNNAGEDAFLYSYAKEYLDQRPREDEVYIGYSDEITEGVWKWCTDEYNSYTNWAPGEPSNTGDEDYCGYYFRQNDGKWVDNKPSRGYGFAFLCEWDVDFVLNKTKIVMERGATKTIKYTLSDDNRMPSFKTSNKSVAKVSSKGKVVAKGTGSCMITCSVAGIKKAVTVIVKPAKIDKFKSVQRGNNYFKFAWTKQSGVDYYQIYMYDDDLEEYVKVKTVKGTSKTATVSGLEPGTVYRFMIRSFFKHKGKNYFSPWSSVLKATTKS